MDIKTILMHDDDDMFDTLLEELLHKPGCVGEKVAALTEEVVKPLIEECSKLAAFTCCVDGGLVGDEGGHTYCTMYRKLCQLEKAYDDQHAAFTLSREEARCLKVRLEGAEARTKMVQESKEKIIGHYNAAVIKKIKAIGLLNSMVSGGEQHTKNSLELMQVALDS